MTQVVENLGKLERRIALSVAKEVVRSEVQSRIRQIAKNVRLPGFRPGKAPLKIVERRYAQQIEAEVLHERINKAFLEISQTQNLKIAGAPRFLAKENAVDAEAYVFDATFEIYPDISFGDLAKAQIMHTKTTIGEAEIDRAFEMLRKQRVQYQVRSESSEEGSRNSDASAQDGDQATVDFVGKIDDQVFKDSTATDFTFVLGEGRMPPDFEKAVVGLKPHQSRAFELTFPADYHDQAYAGKKAQFSVTLRKAEQPCYPEIDTDFASSFGIADGDIAKLRAQIKETLEREAERCTQLLLKQQVMKSLLAIASLEAPKALLEKEQQRLAERAFELLKQRGMTAGQQAKIPAEIFKEQAERRVKLGLIVAELINKHGLHAEPEQIRAEVETQAKSYEDPQQFVRWCYSDQQRLAEVQASVVENNVVRFILDKAQVTDKQVSFETLAGAAAAPV